MGERDKPRCGKPFPQNARLHCLKPAGHEHNEDFDHATCLGYHPDTDEWEWANWFGDDVIVLVN